MTEGPAHPGPDPHWTVAEEDDGVRLDKFLAGEGRLGSRGRAAGALARGKVFVNDVEATDGGGRVATGDRVRVWMDRPGSAKPRVQPGTYGALEIVFEDSDLVVVNKPAGLLSVPLERRAAAPSVYDLVDDHFRPHGKRQPLVVHRIDRDTSGLVVFAKTAHAQARLKEQFKRREPDRVYQAVVYGHPDPPAGTWRDILVWDTTALIQKETHPHDPRGKEAISEYRVLETFRDASLLEVRLTTGKRNQIRIQARLRGHTLVGERRYVFGPDTLRPIPFGRQALHAWRLTFRHPAGGRTLTFDAPLPRDFVDLLARLRPPAR
ncbi:MAG TPA: RluA family pseudouridine synthase [Vicinamibacterales bacterium]|nr:RluA family pseudouridine synthase [Vicinamibacterales bacterium]